MPTRNCDVCGKPLPDEPFQGGNHRVRHAGACQREWRRAYHQRYVRPERHQRAGAKPIESRIDLSTEEIERRLAADAAERRAARLRNGSPITDEVAWGSRNVDVRIAVTWGR